MRGLTFKLLAFGWGGVVGFGSGFSRLLAGAWVVRGLTFKLLAFGWGGVVGFGFGFSRLLAGAWVVRGLTFKLLAFGWGGVVGFGFGFSRLLAGAWAHFRVARVRLLLLAERGGLAAVGGRPGLLRFSMGNLGAKRGWL